MKKSNKGLRIYMNYRALNALIVFNKNTLLLIKKILIKLYAIKLYSKFDIIVAFNKIRIRRDDEHKTIFLIRYSLFEYNVILFKLYNASIIF